MLKLEEEVKDLIQNRLDAAATIILTKHPAPLEEVIALPMAKLEALGEGLRLIAHNGGDGIHEDLGVLFDKLMALHEQVLLVARKIDEASSD